MTDSNREAFERHFGFSGIMLKRDLDVGYYLNVDIENVWDGWQAATAHNKEKLVEILGLLHGATAWMNQWHRTYAIEDIERARATLTDMIGGE